MIISCTKLYKCRYCQEVNSNQVMNSLKSRGLFLDMDKLQLHLAVSGYICYNDIVTIDACGMHEIGIFAEALKLQLGCNGCSGNK